MVRITCGLVVGLISLVAVSCSPSHGEDVVVVSSKSLDAASPAEQPGISFGTAQAMFPGIIAPAKGRRLLWVQLEVRKTISLPQKLDLRAVVAEDSAKARHGLVGFGVGIDRRSRPLPEIEYVVTADGLQAEWMVLQSPLKADDKMEGSGVGKVAVSFERGKLAQVDLIQLPTTLRLLFAVPESEKRFVIKGVVGHSLTIEHPEVVDLLRGTRNLPSTAGPPREGEVIRSVRRAIADGKDLNAADGFGMTPLHKAALAGDMQAVQLLVTNGAKIDLKDNGGESALHMAARMGRTAVAKLLVAKGASIRASDAIGNTPLHAAAGCLGDDKESVATLLEAGAQVDAKTSFAQTPLHMAAWAGNVAVVELLLSKGADPQAKNSQGATPLQEAERANSNRRVIELLRRSQAK